MADPQLLPIKLHPLTGDGRHQQQARDRGQQQGQAQRLGRQQRQGQHQGQVKAEEGEANQGRHGVAMAHRVAVHRSSGLPGRGSMTSGGW